MGDAIGQQGGRRYFVGVGVAEYADETLNLEHALDDVEQMASWFVDEVEVPYERKLEALSSNPTASTITESLSEFLDTCGRDDIVVIWISCHGEFEGGEAYLFGRNTPRSRLAGRAVSASSLGRILGQSPPHRFFVVVDACAGGNVASLVAAAAEQTSTELNNRDPFLSPVSVFVASAYGRDPAFDGRFAEAFHEVVTHQRWTGTRSRWLTIDQLLTGLNEELRGVAPQVVDLKRAGPGLAEFIPNPNFVEARDDGPYFTGRVHELTTIATWLAGDDGASRLVITGSPGCGKSALLARAVADDGGARLSGVVSCHNKTARQVITELAGVLGGTAASSGDLVALAGDRRFVIAIDSLDEAVEGDARFLAGEVLVPLSDRAPGVRLLIATRPKAVHGDDPGPDLVERLATPDPLNLDDAANGVSDMTDCVLHLLAERAVADEAAERLAQQIVAQAKGSFLVATIAARAIDPDQAEFKLPGEVGAALAEYIEQLPAPREKRDLLRALAWASGSGLPWAPLWPPVATELAAAVADAGGITGGRGYGDEDVGELLAGAGDLITETSDSGRPVYRLFHEELAEHLRGDVAAVEAQRAFVDAIGGARGEEWSAVDPYVLKHLPGHLRGAERYDELVDLLLDPTWERALRESMGTPVAAAEEVGASIGALQARNPSDLRVVPIAVAHSRAMRSAAPLVIEVFAMAGQLPRALAMADNLVNTADRILAHRLLAAALAAEGEQDRARQCVDEIDRSLVAVRPEHLPMGHYSSCRASLDIGDVERARRAAGAAADAATALAHVGDEWDLPNGLFWAGLACREAGAEDRRVELRQLLLERVEVGIRNQQMQAAAVLGATEPLLELWKQFRDLDGGGWMRRGNLALALVDAGMNSEAEALFVHVGNEPPTDEPDTNKRWAMALALAGRLDEAVGALAHVHDPIETGKAIARLVRIAVDRRDRAVQARLGQMIDGLLGAGDERNDARLVNALWRVGRHDAALARAEVSVAAQHRDQPLEDPRDGGLMVIGGMAVKTGRREMVTSREPIVDEQLRNTAEAAAQRGDFVDAREQIAAIKAPRYRAEALAALAGHEALASPDRALDTWLQAVAAARSAGSGAVRELLDTGCELLVQLGRKEAAERLIEHVERVDALWELEAFAEQYAGLRRTLEPGPDRTARLERLMLGPARLARDHVWTPGDVTTAWASNDDGKRLFALAIIKENPELMDHHVLVDAIRGSRSAFEQYKALGAAVACAAAGRRSPAVDAAARAERDGEPRPDGVKSNLAEDSDRAKLVQELVG